MIFPTNLSQWLIKIVLNFLPIMFLIKMYAYYLTKEAYQQVCMAIDKGGQIDRKWRSRCSINARLGAIQTRHSLHTLASSSVLKSTMPFLTYYFGGTALENFDGAQLAQQEPDASSFPSGGIRKHLKHVDIPLGILISPVFIYRNNIVYYRFCS